MDTYCTNCAEPWSVDYVLHEAPQDFLRQGSKILSCPSCKGEKKHLSKKQEDIATTAATFADLLGDDIDGLAAMMEDFLAHS